MIPLSLAIDSGANFSATRASRGFVPAPTGIRCGVDRIASTSSSIVPGEIEAIMILSRNAKARKPHYPLWRHLFSRFRLFALSRFRLVHFPHFRVSVPRFCDSALVRDSFP
jgi:hypothetical protein